MLEDEIRKIIREEVKKQLILEKKEKIDKAFEEAKTGIKNLVSNLVKQIKKIDESQIDTETISNVLKMDFINNKEVK